MEDTEATVYEDIEETLPNATVFIDTD